MGRRAGRRATISGPHMIHESPRGDSDLRAAEAKGWTPSSVDILLHIDAGKGTHGNMNLCNIARQSVRNYFAPLVWVWLAIYRPQSKS